MCQDFKIWVFEQCLAFKSLLRRGLRKGSNTVDGGAAAAAIATTAATAATVASAAAILLPPPAIVLYRMVCSAL